MDREDNIGMEKEDKTGAEKEENTGAEKDENTGAEKNMGSKLQELAIHYTGYSMFITLFQAICSICGVFLNNRALRILSIVCAIVFAIFTLVMLLIISKIEISSRMVLILNILGLIVTIVFILFAILGVFRPSIFEPTPSTALEIITPSEKIAAGNDFSMLLRSDKTVVTYGPATGINTSNWANITQIAAYKDHAIGLLENGSVVVTGAHMEEYDVSDWSNIRQVAACKNGVIGLTKNETIEFEGPSKTCLLDCEEWTSVMKILGAAEIIVVQMKNKNLAAVDRYQNIDLLGLNFESAIASVTAVGDRVLYVLENGNVEATGNSTALEKQIATWKGINQIAVGNEFAVGLNKDGKAICLGAPTGETLDVSGWEKVVGICAGKEHVLGLCEDGTVLTAGNISNGLGEIANEKYWVE